MEEITATKTEPNVQSTNTETQQQSKPEQQLEDKTPNVKNDKEEAEMRRLDALTRRANHRLEIQSKKLMESNGEV